jgi:hypothetical protein
VTFAGGGRYSLDKLIMNRKKIKIIPVVKTAIASLLLLIGLNASAQNSTVRSKDFTPLAGKWTGTLTYLDYSSNKLESIKANLYTEIKNDSLFELNIYYTDEPSHNAKDEYRIREKGTIINDTKVIERTALPNGVLKIVLEEKGKDGNDSKPATFHHVMLISKNKFTLTKLVKFDGEATFFQRNQYTFSR